MPIGKRRKIGCSTRSAVRQQLVSQALSESFIPMWLGLTTWLIVSRNFIDLGSAFSALGALFRGLWPRRTKPSRGARSTAK